MLTPTTPIKKNIKNDSIKLDRFQCICYSDLDMNIDTIQYLTSGSYNRLYTFETKTTKQILVLRRTKETVSDIDFRDKYRYIDEEVALTILMSDKKLSPMVHQIGIDEFGYLFMIMDKYTNDLHEYMKDYLYNIHLSEKDKIYTNNILINNIVLLVKNIVNEKIILLDIKPKNIVINGNNYILKAIDFDSFFVINDYTKHSVYKKLEKKGCSDDFIKELFEIIMLIMLANHFFYYLNYNVLHAYMRQRINEYNGNYIKYIFKHFIYIYNDIFTEYFYVTKEIIRDDFEGIEELEKILKREAIQLISNSMILYPSDNDFSKPIDTNVCEDKHIERCEKGEKGEKGERCEHKKEYAFESGKSDAATEELTDVTVEEFTISNKSTESSKSGFDNDINNNNNVSNMINNTVYFGEVTELNTVIKNQ